MKHGSLFSGIGGFDLAAEWMGWENKFHCEINPFCQRVLKHYWPDAHSFGDIKIFGIKNLWEEFVQNVKNRNVCRENPIADRVTLKEQRFGGIITEKNIEEIALNGPRERNLRFSSTTAASVFVVENLKWNFSQLTIRKIMAMKNEDFTSPKLGNLLLNEDFPMTIKSYALTAITQELITEFVHILNQINVDIISGGFPCQPFSSAGKREGKDDNRYLWPQMLRAIREIQPRWIVGENVRGLTNWNGGMVFDEVQADLETESYEVLPFLLPACAVNAPHRRDRIWFIAYAAGFRQQGEREFGNALKHSEKRDWETNWPKLLFRGKSVPHLFEHINGVPERLGDYPFSEFNINANTAFGNAVVPQLVYEIFKTIEQYEVIHSRPDPRSISEGGENG